MSSSEMTPSVAVQPAAWIGKFRFFSAMPVVLLAIVVVGFSPTFYLAPLYDAPPLPPSLLVHGAIMTAWFVLFVVQAALAVQGRLTSHRKLGRVALALAVAIVVSGVFVLLERVPRIVDASAGVEAALDRASPILWSSVAMLTAFSTFVTAGVLLVRRTDVHRRLMLLASLSMMPPAVARIFGLGTPATAATLVLLIVALFAYDTWRLGRPLAVTWLGGVGLIAWSATLVVGVGGSSFGRAVALLLR